jgi:hypothetical protein
MSSGAASTGAAGSGAPTEDAGGNDAGGSGSPGSSGSAPEGGAGPTFAAVYSMILQPHCSMKCHTGAAKPDGNLGLATQMMAYMNLVGKPASGMMCMGKGTLVVPGNSAMSILYSKVSSATPVCGAQMPKGCKGAMCLAMTDVDMIKAWIDAGAQMN